MVQKEETRRDDAVDLVRTWGLLAIVVGHLWSGELIRNGIYTWHVPLFFLLTGYLWKEGKSYRAMVRAKISSLIIPYTTWLLLISIPVVLLLIQEEENPIPAIEIILLGGANLGSPFSAFWFVTSLFFATLLFKLFERLNTRAQIFTSLAIFGLWPPIATSIDPLPFALETVPIAIAYIALGKSLKKFIDKIKKADWKWTTFALTLSLLPFFAGLTTALDLKQMQTGTPIISLILSTQISMLLLVIAFKISNVLPEVYRRYNSYFVSCGLALILNHTAMIYIFTQINVPKYAQLIAIILANIILYRVMGTMRLPAKLLYGRNIRGN